MSAVDQGRTAVRSRVAPANPVAPAVPSRPPLRVVPNRQGLRVKRRRGRVLVGAIGLLVAAGMFAIVGAQVILTQRQLRLDQVNQALAAARTTNDQLALQVATLESPSRIVSEAKSRLDMVAPPRVVYLTPGANPVAKVAGLPASVPSTGATSTSVPPGATSSTIGASSSAASAGASTPAAPG